MNKAIGALLLWGIGISAPAQQLEDIRWMSEQYPPYNYLENGRPTGITVEVLVEVLKRVGFSKPKTIEFLPWAESYEATMNDPGSALFSTTYTEERSKLFKFVQPIVSSIVSLVGKKSRHLEIHSVADMNQLKIVVTTGYAFHKDTDPGLVEELQETLDILREEGFIDKVVGKYLN